MDLLRNLFGNVTSGIIRLAVTAGVLFLCYLFIIKPVLDTTTDAIHSTGLDQIGKSLEGMSKQVKREVHRSFEVTKQRGANPQKLVNCVKRANGDIKRIERCTRRF
jgi:maltooligosyltrehalose synthase